VVRTGGGDQGQGRGRGKQEGRRRCGSSEGACVLECQNASSEEEENGLLLNLDASRRLKMCVFIIVCFRMCDQLHVIVLCTTCNSWCGQCVSPKRVVWKMLRVVCKMDIDKKIDA